MYSKIGQKKKEEDTKNSFINLYLESILQIIEDKPNFLISTSIYCLLIIIYYHQISGYILSHYEVKAMTEEMIEYIAYLNEVSPGTFLLYMRGK